MYPTSGAYHGVDLHMVFGTAENVTGIPDSSAEERTNRYISSAWVKFAMDPEAGLDSLGWPRYHPNGKSMIC
jgi:carboxylesterase type B